MCCCLFSSDPIEDERGIYLTFDGPNKFKVQTLHAPFRNFFTFLYCLGQFFPLTCGITQYMLRRKILKGDMTKYSCFRKSFFSLLSIHFIFSLYASLLCSFFSFLHLFANYIIIFSIDFKLNFLFFNFLCIFLEGQFDCCCIKSGELNESSCPNFCLCLEAHCCNGLAISASRNLVMFR